MLVASTRTSCTAYGLIRLIIEHFKQRVQNAAGGNYQTLINEALREHIQTQSTQPEETLRKVISEELKAVG